MNITVVTYPDGVFLAAFRTIEEAEQYRWRLREQGIPTAQRTETI